MVLDSDDVGFCAVMKICWFLIIGFGGCWDGTRFACLMNTVVPGTRLKFQILFHSSHRKCLSICHLGCGTVAWFVKNDVKHIQYVVLEVVWTRTGWPLAKKLMFYTQEKYLRNKNVGFNSYLIHFMSKKFVDVKTKGMFQTPANQLTTLIRQSDVPLLSWVPYHNTRVFSYTHGVLCATKFDIFQGNLTIWPFLF